MLWQIMINFDSVAVAVDIEEVNWRAQNGGI